MFIICQNSQQKLTESKKLGGLNLFFPCLKITFTVIQGNQYFSSSLEPCMGNLHGTNAKIEKIFSQFEKIASKKNEPNLTFPD